MLFGRVEIPLSESSVAWNARWVTCADHLDLHRDLEAAPTGWTESFWHMPPGRNRMSCAVTDAYADVCWLMLFDAVCVCVFQLFRVSAKNFSCNWFFVKERLWPWCMYDHICSWSRPTTSQQSQEFGSVKQKPGRKWLSWRSIGRDAMSSKDAGRPLGCLLVSHHILWRLWMSLGGDSL